MYNLEAHFKELKGKYPKKNKPLYRKVLIEGLAEELKELPKKLKENIYFKICIYGSQPNALYIEIKGSIKTPKGRNFEVCLNTMQYKITYEYNELPLIITDLENYFQTLKLFRN